MSQVLGGGYYWHRVGRGQGCRSNPTMQRKPLPPRMIQGQMSPGILGTVLSKHLLVKVQTYNSSAEGENPCLQGPPPSLSSLSLLPVGELGVPSGACPPLWMLLTALSWHSSAWSSVPWTQNQGETQVLFLQWTLFDICPTPTPALFATDHFERWSFWPLLWSMAMGGGVLFNHYFFLFQKSENLVMQSNSTHWPPFFSLW